VSNVLENHEKLGDNLETVPDTGHEDSESRTDKLNNTPKNSANKKLVLKLGSTILAEKDLFSESDEENLVMDFSDTEENL